MYMRSRSMSRNKESASLTYNEVAEAWKTGMGPDVSAELTNNTSAFRAFSDAAVVQCLFWVSIHHFDLIYPVLSCIDYLKPIGGRLGGYTSKFGRQRLVQDSRNHSEKVA